VICHSEQLKSKSGSNAPPCIASLAGKQPKRRRYSSAGLHLATYHVNEWAQSNRFSNRKLDLACKAFSQLFSCAVAVHGIDSPLPRPHFQTRPNLGTPCLQWNTRGSHRGRAALLHLRPQLVRLLSVSQKYASGRMDCTQMSTRSSKPSLST
jgi:hypothetical protein